MTFRTLLLMSALTLSAVPAHGQQVEIQQMQITGPPAEGMPFGGPARPLRTGSGRIRGRVLSETGAPVRRAQVRLGGADVGARSATTDADGRFEFLDLPDGRFTLSATKAGYVNASYGQTRPLEPGKPIELAAKQTLDKADILLPRGSAITGRIVDEVGEPVAEAMVTALRQEWSGGKKRLVNAGRTSQTNDLGQFRMYGLPPGEYYVSATLRNMDGMMMDIMAAAAPAVAARVATAASGYAASYYPGTTASAEAQKITVAPGQETQGVDFPLAQVRLARVTGIVLNSEGKPLEGTMVTLGGRGADNMPGMNGTARTGREGAFSLSSVAPGDYTLQVIGMTMMTTGSGDNMMFTARIGMGGGDTEFASVPLNVSGEDLSNLVITTSKGATATGKVTFEGQRPPGDLRVTAVSSDDGGMMAMGAAGAAIAADGTFTLKGLTGPSRVLRLRGLPAGYTLKAVEQNGIDITDSGIDIKGAEALAGIDLVVSSRSTEITGAVSGSDGAPVKDFTLVVFAEDADKWALPATRWVTGVRPDQDGRVRIKAMPSGSYYGIAVDYLPQGEWNNPETLERLKAKAQHFTLGEGETKTLELKLVGS
ncbi:MAG: carboxypeptidase-like regulatory domain-containing protein [Vicinamibacterales bacterium]